MGSLLSTGLLAHNAAVILHASSPVEDTIVGAEVAVRVRGVILVVAAEVEAAAVRGVGNLCEGRFAVDEARVAAEVRVGLALHPVKEGSCRGALHVALLPHATQDVLGAVDTGRDEHDLAVRTVKRTRGLTRTAGHVSEVR